MLDVLIPLPRPVHASHLRTSQDTRTLAAAVCAHASHLPRPPAVAPTSATPPPLPVSGAPAPGPGLQSPGLHPPARHTVLASPGACCDAPGRATCLTAAPSRCPHVCPAGSVEMSTPPRRLPSRGCTNPQMIQRPQLTDSAAAYTHECPSAQLCMRGRRQHVGLARQPRTASSSFRVCGHRRVWRSDPPRSTPRLPRLHLLPPPAVTYK